MHIVFETIYPNNCFRDYDLSTGRDLGIKFIPLFSPSLSLRFSY